MLNVWLSQISMHLVGWNLEFKRRRQQFNSYKRAAQRRALMYSQPQYPLFIGLDATHSGELGSFYASYVLISCNGLTISLVLTINLTTCRTKSNQSNQIIIIFCDHHWISITDVSFVGVRYKTLDKWRLISVLNHLCTD